MIRTSNNKCREYVESLTEFKANNIFSEKITKDKLYIVYSYGYHFPIYMKYKNTWYENTDKYSVSTSKHQSQARPYNFKRKLINTSKMKEIIRKSIYTS
mgnify:CR=1 FL=1|tara:strand:+ start:17629 stop:17925 length:297 start_codon:yes stop_codon:yes gene_type:complete